MSRVAFALVIIASLSASAFACESAQSLIEQAEGYRACEYVDTQGHPTVCYGFNLDKSNAAQQIAAVGGDYSKVRAGGCLSQSQCTQLLQMDMQSAVSGEEQVFGSSICYCVTQALIDMTYNLGTGGISSFTTFRSYIEAGEWAKAAQDARGTLWCSQVGSRCTRDASIIEAGC
eukprot:TRINITY_DN70745_c0_g1_i1.p2 TRINITY_DN70745_c0_g1~~TRINITY_DN70745_c0_g1_i1.p2  ORF type:complete len:186 (+),score=37.55 TRINITY_DN70745_c0_g1_i1:37-558(+)